jgi:hypothetical protein
MPFAFSQASNCCSARASQSRMQSSRLLFKYPTSMCSRVHQMAGEARYPTAAPALATLINRTSRNCQAQATPDLAGASVAVPRRVEAHENDHDDDCPPPHVSGCTASGRRCVALAVGPDARGQLAANGPEERGRGLGRRLRRFVQRRNGDPPRIIPNRPGNTPFPAGLQPLTRNPPLRATVAI